MESATMSELPVIPTPDTDWNLVRERYLDGEPLACIADECGTTANAISIRAHREKWKQLAVRELLGDERRAGEMVRGNLLISCVQESKLLAELQPSRNPAEQDVWSRIRLRLLDTSSKLLGWERDAVQDAKAAKAIDV
jgi:hypothetical protein